MSINNRITGRVLGVYDFGPNFDIQLRSGTGDIRDTRQPYRTRPTQVQGEHTRRNQGGAALYERKAANSEVC